MNKRSAVIQLNDGQRKYGHVAEEPVNGMFHFISFMNEQVYGKGNQVDFEEIPEKDIYEIDFCMK